MSLRVVMTPYTRSLGSICARDVPALAVHVDRYHCTGVSRREPACSECGDPLTAPRNPPTRCSAEELCAVHGTKHDLHWNAGAGPGARCRCALGLIGAYLLLWKRHPHALSFTGFVAPVLGAANMRDKADAIGRFKNQLGLRARTVPAKVQETRPTLTDGGTAAAVPGDTSLKVDLDRIGRMYGCLGG